MSEVVDEPSAEALAELKGIDNEHAIWKKNSPLMYEMCVSDILEWPSLTVDWIPGSIPCRGGSKQQLLLGTSTGNTSGHLAIAEVQVPSGSGAADATPSDDANLAEAEGTVSGAGKVNIVQRIRHDGDVHRARHMPQHPHIVATKTSNSNVYLFDTTKHPLQPEPGAKCQPNVVFKGHSAEGYGLAWSPHKAGLLLSGSNDRRICLWDLGVGASNMTDNSLMPKNTYEKHTDDVEDVAWDCHNPDIFASVGDDMQLILWDARSPPTQAAVASATPHADKVLSVAFHPLHSQSLATSSSDGKVLLHDSRKLGDVLHEFAEHDGEVFQVKWNPTHSTILASCGSDRRVLIWDLARIGDEQDPEDAEAGPPELILGHSGHTDSVPDFAWSTDHEWLAASVGDDNIVQVWQVSPHIFEEDLQYAVRDV